MAERTVTFYAGVNSITPGTAQYAGIQGNHCATDLVFVLDKELVSADYLYRLEFIDGMNTFDTTDVLTVSAADTITVPLIRAWTKAGGAGEARLVISKLNETMSEELILYTLTAHVYFESKDDCESQEDDAVRGLTSLIASVRQAQSSAYQMSVQANQAAAAADSASGAAKAAADEAENASTAARQAAADILAKAGSGAFDGKDGHNGADGRNGTDGSNGIDGADGHGLQVLGIYGTLAELQSVHYTGNPGDAYAIGTAAANDLYVWNGVSSAWQNIGNALGSWTMNDLCIDAGDWNSGTGGWMMDSLCMDSGDWSGPGGAVSTLAEHEVDTNAHSNIILDGNIN